MVNVGWPQQYLDSFDQRRLDWILVRPIRHAIDLVPAWQKLYPISHWLRCPILGIGALHRQHESKTVEKSAITRIPNDYFNVKCLRGVEQVHRNPDCFRLNNRPLQQEPLMVKDQKQIWRKKNFIIEMAIIFVRLSWNFIVLPFFNRAWIVMWQI